MTLNLVVEGCIIKHACYSFSIRNLLLIRKNYCSLISARDCQYCNTERVARRKAGDGETHSYFGCDYKDEI